MSIKQRIRNSRYLKKVYHSVGTWVNYKRALITPTLFSKKLYLDGIGRNLNLSAPETLTEKLMFLKLRKYWNNQLIAKCADKYQVREYVKQCGCEEILTRLYGVWNKPEDINWSALPSKYVLKCNHGSGYNYVCKDNKNTDITQLTKQINQWINERYGVRAAEQGIYDLIPRKIIAEGFIETKNGKPPTDYKFFCSFGKVKFLFVATDRINEQTKFDFYYPDWTYIPVRNVVPNNGPVERPCNLDVMIEYAERLSMDFPIVRVDLYNEEGRVYFGELTFTHFGCINGFSPDSFDYSFGAMFPDYRALKDWNDKCKRK